MRKCPETDTERRYAANTIRLAVLNFPNPAIATFVQEKFSPLDVAWNTAHQRYIAAAAIESEAGEAMEASRQAVEALARQLGNSMMDALGRIDHEAREAAFGMSLGSLFKVNVHSFISGCQDALVWLASRPNLPHDAGARLSLEAALPGLIAARDAHQTAKAAAKDARVAFLNARADWDVGYRKLIQWVEAHTLNEEWVNYLATFSDQKAPEAAA